MTFPRPAARAACVSAALFAAVAVAAIEAARQQDGIPGLSCAVAVLCNLEGCKLGALAERIAALAAGEAGT